MSPGEIKWPVEDKLNMSPQVETPVNKDRITSNKKDVPFVSKVPRRSESSIQPSPKRSSIFKSKDKKEIQKSAEIVNDRDKESPQRASKSARP